MAPKGDGAAGDGSAKIALRLFEDIDSHQMTNGLKHGDYQRYRAYCTRRGARLRKKMKMVCRKKRNEFVNKKVTVGNAKTLFHLQLLLVQAEHAWAQAMERKAELEIRADPRAKHYVRRRLRKAQRHAELLVRCAASIGDERTVVEAQLYQRLLAGVTAWESGAHAEALAELDWCRVLLERLAAAASDGGAVYRKQAERVEQLLRFSRYQLKAGTGEAPAVAVSDEDEARIERVLKAAEAEAATSGKESTAAATAAAEPTTSTPVRKAEPAPDARFFDTLLKLSGDGMNLSDEARGAVGVAMRCAARCGHGAQADMTEDVAQWLAEYMRAGSGAGGGGGGDALKQTEEWLASVNTAISTTTTATDSVLTTFLMAERFLAIERRTHQLVERESPETTMDALRTARLYMALATTCMDLLAHAEAAGTLSEVALSHLRQQLVTREHVYRAFHHFYVGRSFADVRIADVDEDSGGGGGGGGGGALRLLEGEADGVAKAVAILRRVTGVECTAAQNYLRSCDVKDARLTKQLALLRQLVARQLCVLRAHSMVREASDTAAAAAGPDGGDDDASAAPAIDMDSYERSYAATSAGEDAAAGAGAATPTLQLVAPKTTMFDLALSSISMPSVSERAKKKGWFW